jgi:hypothetical protein
VDEDGPFAVGSHGPHWWLMQCGAPVAVQSVSESHATHVFFASADALQTQSGAAQFALDVQA